MAFIIPSGWTRKQGFPQIQGNDAGATLVDEFYTDYDLTDVFMKMPDMNTPYDRDGITGALSELNLSSYAINPSDNKDHAYITLTYQPSDSTIATEDGVDEYFLDNGTLEKALETHLDYKTCWNYDLWEFASVSSGAGTAPAWWATATDKKDASGNIVEGEYCWDKSKPSGGYDDGTKWDWLKVEDRIKPGVESYILPSPVVQERVYYKSKKSAFTAGATVGTLVTPDQTFGISEGAWMVMSATVQKDGRRYLVERSFQWAKEWDEDLYS